MVKRRIWIALAILVGILFLFSANALATELQIKGKSCVLMDAASGQILYEQNKDAKVYPASVTKIMTLVLALEALDNGQIKLDDNVTTSPEAASMGGSQVYLYAGEVRTVNEMLIAISVGSGNDASVAMGEYVSGSLPAFVDSMNAKAKELGMKNTHFANPHGLHDADHYTTADDLAILAYYAIRVPKFLDYTSIYEYEFRPEPKLLTLWNTNRLLKWYDGCDGLKTGYTTESGRCLVATAKRESLRLITVVMGVPEAKGHFTESMKLMNFGFNTYTFKSIFAKDAVVGQIKVGKGAQDWVNIVCKDEVGVLQKKGDKAEITTTIDAETFRNAPIAAGDSAGELIVYQDGKEINRVGLVTDADVGRGGFIKTFVKLIKHIVNAA